MTKADLIDSILTQVPTEHSVTVQFDTMSIEIRSNSDELIGCFRDYFKPFVIENSSPEVIITAIDSEPLDLPFEFKLKEPDPGKSKVKEEYHDLPDCRIVRKRLTGMIFIFDGDTNIAIGPALANSNQVINFVNNRYINHKLNKGGLLGHAAGVTYNGRGLGIAGFSGTGKSTLALHLLSRGASFVSNDRLIIENHGSMPFMYGVAKLPRINPGTALNNPRLISVIPGEELERFSSLSSDELWHLEDKYDVFIDEYFGANRFVLKSRLKGLVILNWERSGSEMTLRRVDPEVRTDLLPAFIKSAGLFYFPDRAPKKYNPSPEDYIDILKQCDTFEITGGIDFEKAADLCMYYLTSQE
ncbi:MAG: HprK-related kinase B [candidate division Zixibacteria bacterium]|nr:HprK-related kinase B [candidate division Zixibacteria bacterium]